MITTYSPVATYIGNGTTATYTFDFKVRQASDILIMVYETDTDLLVFEERGNVLANVTSVTFDALNGGGTIVLPANLALLRKLIIKLAVDAPVQDFRFRNQTDFELRQFENALDQITAQVQRLFEKVSRTFRLSDKASYEANLDMEIDSPPVPNGIPKFDANGEVVEFVTPADIVAAAGGGGFVDTAYAFNGFSGRFNEAFATTDLLTTLQQVINLTYLAPQISISGVGSGTIREYGTSLSNAQINYTTTRRSDPIATLELFANALSVATAIPDPDGESNSLTDSNTFTDNVTYTIQITDDGTTGGPTTVTSNSVTYRWVYPYYVGAGAPGLSAAAVAGLTKLVISSTSTSNQTIVAGAGEVFYFAYPASYGALTSILDVSNFETVADWTLRTENITGLDATAQSYRIYEFNNPVVAGSYFYSFRR